MFVDGDHIRFDLATLANDLGEEVGMLHEGVERAVFQALK
jgi:hypothetical protein